MSISHASAPTDTNVVSSSSKFTDPASRELVHFMSLFSVLSFLAVFAFGLIQILVEENAFLGYLELAGGMAMLINALGVHVTHNVRLERTLLLAIIMVLLLIMLPTGGIEGTGILWFFVFPPAAFFLAGKRMGMIWVAALVAATITLTLLAQLSILHLAYSPVAIRQLLASLLVVSFGIYLYQGVREKSEKESFESKRDLREERVQADTIVDNIGEGIIAIDDENRIVLINNAAGSMLGWTEQEVLSHDFLKTIPLLDEYDMPISEPKHPLIKLFTTGQKVKTTAKLLRKNGSQFPATITATPIIVDKRVVGAILGFHDVSEEQAIDRTKSEFVTLASHQLRTPISAVSWFTEMLLHGDAGKLNEEQIDYVEQIHYSNQRLANMVDAMLMVSSLELGSVHVRPAATDLGVLAHKLLKEEIKKQPHKKELHIVEKFDGDLPKIALDPMLAKTLLQNLFSNAVKYTPTGGQITVTITQTHEKLNLKSKGSVSIAVTDTGYGIAKRDQKKIFAKLFRAENIKGKDTDGTGLGLYVVRALLQRVGGEIKFKSQENKGSTFWITLPLEGMKHTGHKRDGHDK